MMQASERLLTANGVQLCVETYGRTSDPAILLIHGACASMLWWEEELCQHLADLGRFVIRYDNRDTGRSVSYPPGEPGYTVRDLAHDAVGILDALGIAEAHVVGRSMSGVIALILGVDHPDRVASLTFVSTTPGDDDLPPMSEEFLTQTAAGPDLSDPDHVVAYIVGLIRAYAGRSHHFDEPATRVLAERDVARTRDIAAALTNHFRMGFEGPSNGGFGNIGVPTLVVHGDIDPVYPVEHARALAAAVPGAQLLILEGVGHEVPKALWPAFAAALHRHTGG